MGASNRRMRKNEEMFLSCPPEVESLAAPLVRSTFSTATKHAQLWYG